MFFTIEGEHQYLYSDLLDQMFRLRKRIFADKLRWDVRVAGEYEYDQYDALRPVYLVWTNAEKTKLYASIRLMPTSGPTLLYDVFHSTFPKDAKLSSSRIWEATRACVDPVALGEDHRDVNVAQAFNMLLLATNECAYWHGINTIVSNYEPQLDRVYRRAGVQFQEVGRAEGYGRHPVCCSTIEVSAFSVTKMRKKLGLFERLYERAQDKFLIPQNAELAA